jgi:hypothetical protein
MKNWNQDTDQEVTVKGESKTDETKDSVLRAHVTRAQ